MENIPISDMMRLMASPAGQQLLALLKNQDSGTLRKAMNQAEQGDYSGVQATLSALLSDPDAMKLLAQLRGDQNE